MTSTGIRVIEGAIQTFDIWINELQERLAWTDRERAYHALRSVLHALRDRLTIEEAADLSSQLPLLVRGVFWDGWRPAGKPLRERKLADFLDHIHRDFQRYQEVDPEEVTRAVFGLLAAHVSAGEIEDIRRILPEPLRELWQPRTQ